MKRVCSRLLRSEPETPPDPGPYLTYHSLAEPAYHPHLDASAFGADYQRARQDIESEANHDPFARSILFHLAKSALTAPGAFIECGVHHGGGAHLLAFVLDRYDDQNRALWCVDSFQGLSKPAPQDVDARTKRPFFREHDLDNTSAERVEALLRGHRCAVNVVPGWIPAVFAEVRGRQFCFAHVDVDLYQPTLDCLGYLYPRLSAGGILLLDDYGFPMCVGARSAVDGFFRDKPETVVALPTGQAFVRKN